MVVIEFTPQEFDHAAYAGYRRRMAALTREAEGRYGAAPTDSAAWGMDIEGALGEAAVAKYRKLPWSIGSIGAPDVGDNIQVRTTDYRFGHLILHKPDRDDASFYLVVPPNPGSMTRLVIGWIYGWEGKKDCYWKKDIKRPSYWIPQEKLTPCNPQNGRVLQPALPFENRS